MKPNKENNLPLHAGGRPTEYKPDFCEAVIVHMSKGFSFESFAGEVGVCKKTLYNWLDTHEAFAEAVARAKERCRLWWENILLENLVHTQRGKRVDPRLWELNMRCRFPDEWVGDKPNPPGDNPPLSGTVTVTLCLDPNAPPLASSEEEVTMTIDPENITDAPRRLFNSEWQK